MNFIKYFLLHLFLWQQSISAFHVSHESSIHKCQWRSASTFISIAGLPNKIKGCSYENLSTSSPLTTIRTNGSSRIFSGMNDLNGLNGNDSAKNNDDKNNDRDAITPKTDDTNLDNEKVGDLQILMKQFKAFREMAWPYFEESKQGKWLFAGMIVMTLLNSGVSVAFSYVGRDFWSALSSKDQAQFTSVLMKFSAALVAGAPVSVLYRFQRDRLAIEWRRWMTERVLSLYYANRVYYSLERNADNDIDNPDQRIAEDVRSFTAFSLQLFLTIVTSTIDLVSFSFILYSIQPQLFGAIVAYAAFGTITTTAIGRRLVGLNFEKLVKEADFRYSLVRIRENAESIAFYGGEDLEGKEVDSRLSKVIENRKEIIGVERNLEFFTTAYRYLIQVLPVSVVAPQFFAGKIELGVVSQSSGAFNHILSDLSVIVNQFEQLSTFSAGIDRLSEFMEAIKKADPNRPMDAPLMKLQNNTTMMYNSDLLTDSAEKSETSDLSETSEHSTISLHSMESIFAKSTLTNNIPPQHRDTNLLTMQDLTLTTPDRKRTLVSELTLSLQWGQHLLIVGNSGAGKSSLLRAIAGLWTAGSGSIVRPANEDIYFLPQRPYCALGSLKDQLLYPSTTNDSMDIGADSDDGHDKLNTGHHVLQRALTDEELLAVFDAVDLSELPIRAGNGDSIRGLNAVMDWSNTLSLGEQQRLAFGRVLVNRPLLVILDEATSALDMEGEAKMYRLLQNMAKEHKDYGIADTEMTYISVGHRPSLLNYHDQRLRLEGAGKSSLEMIDEKVIQGNPVVANL